MPYEATVYKVFIASPGGRRDGACHCPSFPVFQSEIWSTFTINGVFSGMLTLSWRDVFKGENCEFLKNVQSDTLYGGTVQDGLGKSKEIFDKAIKQLLYCY